MAAQSPAALASQTLNTRSAGPCPPFLRASGHSPTTPSRRPRSWPNRARPATAARGTSHHGSSFLDHPFPARNHPVVPRPLRLRILACRPLCLHLSRNGTDPASVQRDRLSHLQQSPLLKFGFRPGVFRVGLDSGRQFPQGGLIPFDPPAFVQPHPDFPEMLPADA